MDGKMFSFHSQCKTGQGRRGVSELMKEICGFIAHSSIVEGNQFGLFKSGHWCLLITSWIIGSRVTPKQCWKGLWSTSPTCHLWPRILYFMWLWPDPAELFLSFYLSWGLSDTNPGCQVLVKDYKGKRRNFCAKHILEVIFFFLYMQHGLVVPSNLHASHLPNILVYLFIGLFNCFEAHHIVK